MDSGQIIAHYRILEKLGEGGMGAVYKAHDLTLDRMVALKTLPSERAGDAERKQRLLQEARAASALNHPNIVVTYEVASIGDVSYIAMEYVEGRSLFERIRGGRLPLTEVLECAIQIADALAAAHAAGLVHRDLKPANVIVNPAGRVKVLDFGLAKFARPGAGDASDETQTMPAVVTREGTVFGTAAYMSPEQAEGRKLDGRSDIFSFGAMLYEMVTGRRAFPGESAVTILSAVMRDEPRPAQELVAGLPADLDRIISRCLRKDRDRRVQSAADLKVMLCDLQDAVAAGKLEETEPAGRRALVGRLGWAALLVAAVALAAAVWMARGNRDTAPGPSQPVPVTGNPGHELDASFSPDGNEVAYSWDGPAEDNFDIYIKMIGSGSSLRLTRDPAPDFSAAWSPDGRFMAFLRALGPDKVALMVVSRLGGAERRVADFLTLVHSPWSRNIAWSADGKYIIAPIRTAPAASVALHAIPVEGGEPRKLAAPPAWASLGDEQPAISRDGRMLAFARRSATITEIFTMQLTADLHPASEPRRRTSEGRDYASPVWTADGRDLVFASLVIGGTGTLWRMPAAGNERPRMVSQGEGGTSAAVSRQGNRLAFARRVLDENIWRIERGAAHSTPLIASTQRDWEPHFSLDGRRIVFSSDRTGSMQVWMADSDGSNQGQLTSMSATVTGGARFSPDGEHIVFISNAEGQIEIYLMNATGGGVKRLTNHPGHDSAPSWSRDGKWIYFGSDRGGDYQVWKMPSGGGEATQVTRKGGFAALESADGRYLYFSRREAREGVWKVALAGGEETRVVESIWRWGSFEVVNDGIYFIPAEGNSVRFYRFATGTIDTIARLTRPLAFGLTATADGRTILYPQVDQDRSELLLVEGFR